MSGRSGTGLVLASYGRGALVQSGTETLSCALRGRKQRVVCGDRVHWVSGESDGGPAIDALEQIAARLERVDARAAVRFAAHPVDSIAAYEALLAALQCAAQGLLARLHQRTAPVARKHNAEAALAAHLPASATIRQ